MSIAFQFAESETKILLESLAAQERQLLDICQTSEDDEAVADAGNDLVELRLLLDRVRKAAVAEFGEGVLNFSRDLL